MKKTTSTLLAEKETYVLHPSTDGNEQKAVEPNDPVHAVDETTIIGWILQGGVIVSSSIILLGTLLLPFHPGGFTTQRLLTFPHTFAQEWTGLLILRPQAIIVLGLVLLIATPVMRVVVSIFAFAMEHDRRYVIITLVVLAILLTSFLLGKGGA